MLRLSDFWLADGTFKTAPPLFTQVYVVHALRGGPQPMRDGHLLPSLFVLLPNKTEATYRRMWEQIPTLCSLAQPREMLLDFEKAAINSFEEVRPDDWSGAASFTSHRTYGARCRLLECKLTTIRMRSWLSHPTAASSRICFALRCTAPVCSCSAAAIDAISNRASLVLRADLHRAYTTKRHPP